MAVVNQLSIIKAVDICVNEATNIVAKFLSKINTPATNVMSTANCGPNVEVMCDHMGANDENGTKKVTLSQLLLLLPQPRNPVHIAAPRLIF